MPLYTYTCPCGKTFDRILKIHERDDQRCACGQAATREEVNETAMQPSPYRPGVQMKNGQWLDLKRES